MDLKTGFENARIVTGDGQGSFRATAGRFATGVAIATSRGSHGPVGMTVNSFVSVSLDPELILICVKKGCRLDRAVDESGHYALTLLAQDQRDLGRAFASRKRPIGMAQFAEVPTEHEPSTGCLLLTQGVAYFACRLERKIDAGDHAMLLGNLVAHGPLRPVEPLIFLDGAYARAVER